MPQKSWLKLMLLGLTVALPAAKKPAQTVTVVPLCISATKSILLARDKQTLAPYLRSHQMLQIRLQVIAPAIHNPQRCVKLHIKSAMFNDGTALQPIPRPVAKPIFIPLQMRYAMEAAGDLGFPVALNFLPPGPRVQRIATLGGSFVVVAGGTVKTYVLGPVKALLGRDVPAADLSGAAIRVHVEKQRLRANGKPEKLLRLHLFGRPDILSAVVVRRKGAGQSASAPADIFMDMPHGIVVGIPLTQPLQASTSVKLTLRIDEKMFLVPFSLKNLLLPR